MFARSLCLATLLLAAPAAAQDRTAVLERLLQEVPVTALGDGRATTISFGDLVVGSQVAVRRILAGAPDNILWQAAMRAMPPQFGQSEAFSLDELEVRYGFAGSDIEALLEVSAPPYGLSIVIDLIDPAGEAITRSLGAQGFETVTMAGAEILARGEDNTNDIENWEAPFGMDMGYSARVWVVDDLVLNATTSAIMVPMIEGADTLADDDLIAALVDAIEIAPAGTGPLARAEIFLGYPSEAVEAVLIADFAGMQADGAILAMTLSDPAQGPGLRDTIAANWADGISPMTRRSFTELLPELDVQLLPGDPAVLVLITETPAAASDDFNQNRGFQVLMTLVQSLDTEALMAPR